MKKKLFLLATMMILAGCQTNSQNTTTTTATTETTSEVTTTQATTLATQTTSDDKAQASITINITVDGEPIENSPFTLNVNDGDTLLDVMKAQLDIVEKDGFISSINGHEQNAQENKWWLFDYNGQMSEVGAADVKLKDGDQIDWKLAPFE
ncbi:MULTISPECIES: DUF4430 domain-containing protein [unclassified Facklamia]|uniref:DUF4430 domain-containing protein n=1 Tax=Aerococcaceae TaxID=186827 RepID=UPI0013BCAA73|nr:MULTISPECIES: DUF4430 domain-containing protein [unclassified Facklamia]MBS4461960.1 DUF4430 domain-containing protein [Aerococcaceae bacterium zg-B36]NEW64424.1 DUF4430 domain-containing protein [Facklamia sp. 252]NEW67631.1 DUF4430 domain-containing protein [Facklamia sp. 253]QQD65612.1 DUF4430 domain-containing protein [Aerococcaceae bacterium zg-252]